jgi:hypothetical protein
VLGDRAVSWSRGFFRIWIVLSILWVIGMGSYLWAPIFGGKVMFEHWYRFDWTEGAVQMLPDRQPLPAGVKWTTLTTRDLAYHLRHAEGIAPADLERALAVMKADLDELQADSDRARREMMPFYMGLIVVPPLLLLALGWLLGWIAAGFRRAA